MRENRMSGSKGGEARLNAPFLPLSSVPRKRVSGHPYLFCNPILRFFIHSQELVDSQLPARLSTEIESGSARVF
jgi:hypothetical protein